VSGTDSAGVPWAGRRFESNASADDDGSAPEELESAIRGFRSGTVDAVEVIEAVRRSRLLMPLVAELGESGVSPHGHLVDKSQELSIVRVAGPDGRVVQPAFLSVQSMAAWNQAARPVPAAGPRVALAAADEGTDIVVLDPTSATEFAIRRPALWALAQGETWLPPVDDPRVVRAVEESVQGEPAIETVTLEPGDPECRLAGPEVVIRLALRPGLAREELDALLSRLAARWERDETIARSIDSMAVRVARAA
jgi:hypothetical protein